MGAWAKLLWSELMTKQLSSITTIYILGMGVSDLVLFSLHLKWTTMLKTVLLMLIRGLS